MIHCPYGKQILHNDDIASYINKFRGTSFFVEQFSKYTDLSLIS